MKFCSACGASVTFKVPEGDNLPRYVCTACEIIHYQNPKIVTGCIPEWAALENGKPPEILLCKRAIEPRKGLWTLPAGFMENQESTHEAAARETLEEANARVDALELYAVFNIPRIDQVYIMFRAKLLDLDFSPGPESLETQLFKEEEIPWDQLAFPVVAETLKRYYEDCRIGAFPTHFADIK